MAISIPVLGLVLSTFISCSTNQSDPDTSSLQTLTHDGLERRYGMYFPPSYDGSSAMPLVVNIHGGCMDARSQMSEMNMRPSAEENDYILVYPEGAPEEGSEDCLIWNSGPYGENTDNKATADDLGFFTLLIDTLVSDYAIDTDRVYATGFSNGGFMAHALACYQSDTFAAVAPVAGTITASTDPSDSDPCSPTRPVPVIHLHGTQDYSVPIELAEASVAYWREFNNTTESSTHSVEDGGLTIERYSYTGGDNGSSVEYYKVIGGYHEGFSRIDYEGSNSLDLIWDFFSGYDINGVR
ncbi:MAG: PHB depolymerase family esterase [Myxococcota bacterium]|nr:PHB depolymerase family esterase [Myxococcota bacterium]